MGDYNQFIWVKKNCNIVKDPILEIGSKFYSRESFIDYRSLFPNYDYIGSDIEIGKNVDIKLDITDSIDNILKILKYKKFGTIICCSVLEHVDEIFQASMNISKLLNKGGVLFVSVPFVWEEHGYPSDYWRFTPEAIKFLFKDLKFDYSLSTISSNKTNDIKKLDFGLNNFTKPLYENTPYATETNSFIRQFKRGVKFLSDSKFRNQYISKLVRDGNEFKKCCINMIGIKI